MRFFFLLAVFWAFLALVEAQIGISYDPVLDFCRRFSQQSAVIGNRLYIDGGQINIAGRGASNFTNTRLLFHDLSTTLQGAQDIGMPPLIDNLTKGLEVPSVSGGFLWPDVANAKFYLFGGEYPNETPNNFALWCYDVYNDSWSQIQADPSIERIAYGAGTTVESSGLGYYLGGWLSSESVAGWAGPPLASSKMVVYDMIGNNWQNYSSPVDGLGRAEGVLEFIPAGDAGLLIYFGGVLAPGGIQETAVPSPMNMIDIYDPASGKWYVQNATGDVPASRRKFCAGATWAQDQSSYNIYLYGGEGFGSNITGFDDVYILSMPSFLWVKAYPVPAVNASAASPHYDLTCNVIKNAQMLVIGGIFPKDMQVQNCDAPSVAGVHNLNLGENDADKVFWNKFLPSLTTYIVPTDVIQEVGGVSTGGATVTTPALGFGHPDLATLFGRQATLPVRAPTRLPPIPTTSSPSGSSGSKKNLGVIIGPAVGGGAVVIGAIIFYLCYRRRKLNDSNNAESSSATQIYPQQLQPQNLNPVPIPMTYTNTYPSPPTSPAPAYPSYSLMQPTMVEYQQYGQPMYQQGSENQPSELDSISSPRALPSELPYSASPPPKDFYDSPQNPPASRDGDGNATPKVHRRPTPQETNFTFYKGSNNSG